MQFRNPDLVKEENWVVVNKNGVHHYPTFHEALKGESGNLMTENYYQYHYKNLE